MRLASSTIRWGSKPLQGVSYYSVVDLEAMATLTALEHGEEIHALVARLDGVVQLAIACEVARGLLSRASSHSHVPEPLGIRHFLAWAAAGKLNHLRNAHDHAGVTMDNDISVLLA